MFAALSESFFEVANHVAKGAVRAGGEEGSRPTTGRAPAPTHGCVSTPRWLPEPNVRCDLESGTAISLHRQLHTVADVSEVVEIIRMLS